MVLAKKAPLKTKIKDKRQQVKNIFEDNPNRWGLLDEKNYLFESDSVSSTTLSSTKDSNSKNLSHSSDSSDDEKSVLESPNKQSSDDSDDDKSVLSLSTNPRTSINEGTSPVCDWICKGCKGEKPGSKLQLKKCQHPGGQCEKFVHHLCAVNWAVAHQVDEPGNTCREHTTGY